jgi:hypothetical protein
MKIAFISVKHHARFDLGMHGWSDLIPKSRMEIVLQSVAISVSSVLSHTDKVHENFNIIRGMQ